MGTDVATFSPEFWAERSKQQASQEPGKLLC